MTWLSFSGVPITLYQLWEVLSIEKGSRCIDDEFRLRSPQDILALGNSLITTCPDGYVMLAHLSVRDYLLSSRTKNNPETAKFSLNPETCHMELARDCLTYLSFADLSSGPANTQEEYLSRLKQLPLLQYASKYWFYHARNAEPDEELEDLTLAFFAPETRENFMSWVQVFNATSPFKWNVFPKHATALYYAASLGLDQVVASLLRGMAPGEVDAPGSRFGGTAIHAATIRGHLGIIKQLISAVADPGKADFNQVTPLHSAASQNSLGAIRILLDHGAPREARDGMDFKTPAEWARFGGHLDAAEMIQEHPGSVNEAQGHLQSCSRMGGNDEPRRQRDTPKVEVWKPTAGYFPDYYERRSGLDTSQIISITVGEETANFDDSFTPVRTEGEADELVPVW